MSPVAAWLVVIFGLLLPLAHVILSPSAGPWRAPAGSRCPFSPRVGWVVIVLFAGPIGWLMFLAALRRRRRALAAEPPAGA